MRSMLKYTCYTFTAIGILCTIVGCLTSDAGAIDAGIKIAVLFGILSALLHVKRLF